MFFTYVALRTALTRQSEFLAHYLNSKAPDGKTIVHFCIEFKDNGTHLPNLTAALKGGKLGKLTPLSVAPKLGQAGELYEISVFRKDFAT